MVVFSNGIKDRPSIPNTRYRVAAPTLEEKEVKHTPPMISPLDLGLTPSRGFNGYCHRQRACGRLFDCYGFSFCIFAGAIGRVLGIDPYKPHPVLDGNIDICGHCPFTMGVGGAFKLFDDVNQGKIEYPTKTYREGIQRIKREGHIKFPKFQERL